MVINTILYGYQYSIWEGVMKEFENILQFNKSTWQDLPDYGLYAEQLVSYIEVSLKCYFNTDFLTVNMINNYAKMGIIPKARGKKYYREHIAMLIIICILKPMLPMSSIKDAMELQINIMGIEKAYNEFMQVLDSSMKNILEDFSPEKNYRFQGFVAKPENVSLTFVVHAFCFHILSNKIIERKGLYQLAKNSDIN